MDSCGVESMWNMSGGDKVIDDIYWSSYLYNCRGVVYMVLFWWWWRGGWEHWVCRTGVDHRDGRVGVYHQGGGC